MNLLNCNMIPNFATNLVRADCAMRAVVQRQSSKHVLCEE